METINLFTTLDLTYPPTDYDSDRNSILIWEVTNLIKSLGFGVLETNNVLDCTLIFLDMLTTTYNEIEFAKSLNEHKKVKDFYKTKKFIGLSYHEIHITGELEKKLILIEEELNISRSDIFYIDTSLTNRNNTNNIPFELKLRQFLCHVKTIKHFDGIERRSKKLTYLTNKISFSRFRVFDKVLHLYENIENLKKENNISFLNTNANSPYGGSIEHYLTSIDGLYNPAELYTTLDLPWVIDNFPPEWDRDLICQSVYDYHSTSVFSLIMETENDSDLRLTNNPFYQTDFFDKININLLQISEKTVLPLLAGSMPFYITDNLYYRSYEELGFDFSYLKNIFNINYKTNTYYQNYLAINNFINVIKNKTINELNEIRIENIKYIENNNKILAQLIEGPTERELTLFKKMINKI